jgi:hypothetical protein
MGGVHGPAEQTGAVQHYIPHSQSKMDPNLIIQALAYP